MIITYPLNTAGFKIEYHRVREGPNWFMVYYKNVATGVSTPRQMRDRLGPARYLDSTKAITVWMEEMIEKYDSASEEGRADTSFASEVLAEVAAEQPQEKDKTRMVV